MASQSDRGKKHKSDDGNSIEWATQVNIGDLDPESFRLQIKNLKVEEWQYAEAQSYWVGLLDADMDEEEERKKLIEAQLAFSEAQDPARTRLLNARSSKGAVDAKKWRGITKFLHDWIPIAREKGNMKLVEAMQYWLACWISTFMIKRALGGNKQAFTNDMLALRGTKDGHAQYFADLAKGAIKHCTRLFGADSTQPTPSTTAAPTIPTNTPFSTVQPVFEPSGAIPSIANTSHADVHSDEYIQELADKMWDNMDDIETPSWDSIGLVSREMNEYLQEAYEVRRLNLQFPIPDGILLHGPPGTGKTKLVQSFCKHFNVKLVTITPGLKQSLQGHTEKLITKIFHRASKFGQPCAIFFDEIDGLLSTTDMSSTGSSSSLIQHVKIEWSRLMDSKAEVYIFAATNHPDRLDMRDLGRRLSLKVHVRTPDEDALTGFWKLALQNLEHHTIGDDDLKQLARRTLGWVPSEIDRCIAIWRQKLWYRAKKAERWIRVKNDDGEFLEPARAGGPCDLEERWEDMGLVSRSSIRFSAVTWEDMVTHLEKGNAGRRFTPVNGLNADREHEAWALNNATY